MKWEPLWWRKEKNGARCGLCFHRCLIPEDGWGMCGVRGCGVDGLVSPYLGRFGSCAVDPIEKKPLYHWRPGTFIFSLGSVGCNMRCPFCQNHTIAHPEGGAESLRLAELSPEELVVRVREARLSAVAYTYNEPTLQAEYILRAAPLLKDAGIATVLVTNGMFSTSPLNDLLPHVDAANVDVKTFDPAKYASLGGSLETVKANVERMVRAGVHVELTSLVVPGVSDSREDFSRMVDWIAGLSPDVVLHVSRYFPAWRYAAPPTDVALMRALAGAAKRKLAHVHLGNVW